MKIHLIAKSLTICIKYIKELRENENYLKHEIHWTEMLPNFEDFFLED